MSTIEAQIATQTAQANTAREAFNLSAKRSVAETNSGASKSEDRTVSDTVTLSDDAQKVVNLNQGQSLAQDIRNASVDEDFADKLEQATSDVFRISELFNKTVRAAFSLWR